MDKHRLDRHAKGLPDHIENWCLTLEEEVTKFVDENPELTLAHRKAIADATRDAATRLDELAKRLV
jgi:hypothetical protein